MKLQFIIVAFLLSAYLWIGAFYAGRDVYRTAHMADVIPNLHLKDRLSQFL